MGSEPESIRGVAAVPPKGKRPKRFLEKNDTLSLAVSIAEIQETKSLTKAEKHRKLIKLDQPPTSHKDDASNAKAKLKDVKSILLAKKAQAKKERSKLRKEHFKAARLQGIGIGPSNLSSAKPDLEKPRFKRVSFA